jgi:hypothetical protein
MSDVSKGAAIERRAERYLLANGYLVQKAARSVIWIRKRGMERPIPISRRIDLWGAIDFACLKYGERVRLIQVCAQSARSRRRRKVEGAIATVYSEFSDINHIDIEVWSWGQWTQADRPSRKTYGFLVEKYLGLIGKEHQWGVETFIPSTEAPSK